MGKQFRITLLVVLSATKIAGGAVSSTTSAQRNEQSANEHVSEPAEAP